MFRAGDRTPRAVSQHERLKREEGKRLSREAKKVVEDDAATYRLSWAEQEDARKASPPPPPPAAPGVPHPRAWPRDPREPPHPPRPRRST